MTSRGFLLAVAACACRPDAASPTDAPARPQGSLAKAVIRDVVRANIHDVRSCYNARLAATDAPAGANITTPRGRVAVEFTIGPTGAVRRSKVASNDTGDGALGRCIAGAVKRWKFPEPEGGGKIVVTYPFVLEVD
jgi:TonB family protein